MFGCCGFFFLFACFLMEELRVKKNTIRYVFSILTYLMFAEPG